MTFLKKFLTEVATLRKPVTAAAVVALVVELLPGVHVDGTVVAGVLAAVGAIAAFVESQLP